MSKATHIKNNWALTTVMWIYLPILLLISAMACYFSYIQREKDVLSNIHFTYRQLEQHYNDTLENFLQLYLPIFESNNQNYDAVNSYFTSSDDISPLARKRLGDVLNQMLNQDNEVLWIAFYSESRDVNYILFKGNGAISPLPEDFPYLKNLQNKESRLEVYGMENIIKDTSGSCVSSYAICGGVPKSMSDGKIIAGYTLNPYESIVSESNGVLDSLKYIISTKDQLLFHSDNLYDEQGQYFPKEECLGTIKLPDGKKLYICSTFGNSRSALLSFQYSIRELFFYSHGNTPGILLLTVLFVLFSLMAGAFTAKQISKEVDIIRYGLARIGENQLTLRLPISFRQSGLSEIAEAINNMSIRLNENINRIYYYELKQKEAELSELQAKFNPHFLYNSLEMIRSRCYRSGDLQTADLIAQLSAIFRGFIGSKTFIPLAEELAFSKHYLALFSARYKDQIEIKYEIDPELMQYGIIRNIFQPLIENYFVHGFETTEENNSIHILGKSLDNNFMMLTVEDNGLGVTAEELASINASLNEPIRMDTESYGLKNLNQRLKLFYGEDCGLSISPVKPRGLSVHVKVKKILP